MKVQTQTQKIVTLTPEEIQTIVVDYLQSTGIIEDDYEVTIENVPEVLTVKLLSKIQMLVSGTPELEVLPTSTESREHMEAVEPKDDTTLNNVDQAVANISYSNPLAKLVGSVEDMGPNSVFADPIEDLPTPIVTPDLFSDPDEHATQQKAITKDFWGDGEDQIVTKKLITENLFA